MCFYLVLVRKINIMSASTDQITHNNHYVPEFYLRNWSNDGKKIFVYSLLVSNTNVPYWEQKSIRSTAVWNDYYNFHGGWGKKNGNIIIPISPKILLITEIGSNKSSKQLDHSKHWSAFFRRIIIEHAYRYVYADAKQKGMLAIKPRRVDKVLFEKEKKTIAVWHKDQISRERSFFENNT